MSLLLDALKRAAQEKLEKQQRDSVDEPMGETAVGSGHKDLSAQVPPVSAEIAAENIDLMPANTGADDSELKLDPITDSDLRITDLRQHRADVLASELQAFLDRNTTQQNEQTRRSADEKPTLFTFAATPDAAGRIFANKYAGNKQSKHFWLFAGCGGGLLLLLTVSGWHYWNGLNQSNVRLDRLQATGTPIKQTAQSAMDTGGQDTGLLIEQEDIGALLQETLPKTNSSASAAIDEPTNAAVASIKTDRQPDLPRTAVTPRLSVKKTEQEPLHDILMRAYTAYQRNDSASAETGYRQALMRAPENRDALLGLAAVSVWNNDYAAAMGAYEQLLRLDPNDDLALSGMVGLAQAGQTHAALNMDESVIKRLLLAKPDSAQLYFALGNIYSGREDWPKAQSAYFDAHRLDSRNPDYAFNLAISLDHLQQPATALRYYELAIELAGKSKANFDIDQASGRLLILQSKLSTKNVR